VRQRAGWGSWYLALTCSIGCRNSKAARETCARIHAELRGDAPLHTPALNLFEGLDL
jgi:hypothetical protein